MNNCYCYDEEVKKKEKRNQMYRVLNFSEPFGGSYKSYLIHKLVGHKIIEVVDCSPLGVVEYCECGKSWAM